jgi:hypothetical protein
MPTLSDDQLVASGPVAGFVPPEPVDVTPDFWTEAVPAAFRMEHTLESMRANNAPDLSGRRKAQGQTLAVSRARTGTDQNKQKRLLSRPRQVSG